MNCEGITPSNQRVGAQVVSELDCIDDISIALDSISIGPSIGSIAMNTFSLAPSETSKSAGKEQEQCSRVHEGQFTSVYRLHDTENKLGSCTGYVAIKSLNESYLNDEHASRLTNEFNVSRHLASQQCSSVRGVLTQSDFDGLQAILLEWAPGTTLTKWIGNAHAIEVESSAGSMEIILKLA
eukprot:7949367-Ditylum_brightwellii.AAC.1